MAKQLTAPERKNLLRLLKRLKENWNEIPDEYTMRYMNQKQKKLFIAKIYKINKHVDFLIDQFDKKVAADNQLTEIKRQMKNDTKRLQILLRSNS